MPDRMISAFEIIGPTMIGPSSSHTAGAAKLALWARRIAGWPVQRVRYVLQGSFADTYIGHGTDRALLAGFLACAPDDPKIRDAYQLAEDTGLKYEFVADHQTVPDHPNTVRFEILTIDGEEITILGESLGGAAAQITEINGVSMRFNGQLNCLMLIHRDRPGILALITNLMAETKVNIASLSNYRTARGHQAMTLVETDEYIIPQVQEILAQEPDIYSQMILKNDPPQTRTSRYPSPLAGDRGRLERWFPMVEDPAEAVVPSSSSSSSSLSHRHFGETESEDGFDPLFDSGAKALNLCHEYDLDLAQLMCLREQKLQDPGSEELILDELRHLWTTMKESVREPLEDPRPTMGGLIGGEARQLLDAQAREEAQILGELSQDGPRPSVSADSGVSEEPSVEAQETPAVASELPLRERLTFQPARYSQSQLLTSDRFTRAMAYAMAVSEQNASMGRIAAAPTAGGAGVLPGTLLAYQETSEGVDDEAMYGALMVAALVGYLIHLRSSLSGARGGCQSEVGSAAAMTAAALCYLEGGSPEQCLEAAGIALTNLMGLVCDPIGGLVESPCQMRNAGGASIALSSSRLAMAGIRHVVVFDEIIDAHNSVGHMLPDALRETARGGLAQTPSALARCRNCPSEA